METAHFYEVNVNWEEGRKGLMSSPVLDDNIEVVTPPEFTKGIAGKWSPEHLLVAAVNSCLMTTFLAIAENSKLSFKEFTCNANGKLEKLEDKYMITEIMLYPSLTITDERDREKAERVLHKSEAACLITNSVKSKVVMEPKIIFQHD